MMRDFRAVAIVFCIVLAGCKGGYSSPTSPINASGVSVATITIAGRAVSPNAVTINKGERVTFVNNDTVAHTMSSDPHPAHTDCPPLNIGTLAPGQQRDSGTLNTVRSCGFHDHDDPDNVALRGTVTIH
jgi:plastocyanin